MFCLHVLLGAGRSGAGLCLGAHLANIPLLQGRDTSILAFQSPVRAEGNAGTALPCVSVADALEKTRGSSANLRPSETHASQWGAGHHGCVEPGAPLGCASSYP